MRTADTPQTLVFVTGVSQGLGFALFKALIEAGLHPVGIGRSFTTDQEVWAREGLCQLLACDLSNLKAVAALAMKQCMRGGIERLCFISNAGALGPLGPVTSFDSETFRQALAVNVEAPTLLVARLLSEADSLGLLFEIINISSGAASKPLPGMSVYCVGKCAAAMMLNCLSVERPDVVVRHFDPGTVDTSMQETLRCTDEAILPMTGYFRGRHENQQLRPPAEVALEILRVAGLT